MFPGERKQLHAVVLLTPNIGRTTNFHLGILCGGNEERGSLSAASFKQVFSTRAGIFRRTIWLNWHLKWPSK
jgi:hypothetical protein